MILSVNGCVNAGRPGDWNGGGVGGSIELFGDSIGLRKHENLCFIRS